MTYRIRCHLAALIVAGLIGPYAQAGSASENGAWTVDASHTEINFKAKHFFTPVRGTFGDFEIDLTFDAENPEASSVEARIEVASIDTGNERRDGHLRTGDWFEVESHPTMTFASTSVRKVADDKLVATGMLTIKGTAQEVDLEITILGIQEIPAEMQERMRGARRVASFQASTSVKRGDFGVGVGSWAATMIVGGKVDIEILLEAHYK